MKPAARLGDSTSHGSPLSAGPGSRDVLIGDRHAWRALPAALADSVEFVSQAIQSFMTGALHTPANAAPQLAKITTGLTRAAAAATAKGNPQALSAATTATASLNGTNAALSSAWSAASAAPGGQPAANVAYTQGIKAAAAAAAGAVFSAIGAMTDMHTCPAPAAPAMHGPGVVTRGCANVFINDLPAVRQRDIVFEACGGSDPIAGGLTTVLLGD